ncbi:MAG TPA: hypothetical protein DDX19_19335 [Rhodopirellula baltica]|nr:hypothetical protein [Rhodopirellula baltica]
MRLCSFHCCVRDIFRHSFSRTPERRRSTCPRTSLRKRYAIWKSAE